MPSPLSVPDPDLDDEETTLETWSSNHTQNRRRAVGGKLFLTDRRLLFRPHRMDAALAGRAVDVPLDRIASVGTEPGSVT